MPHALSLLILLSSPKLFAQDRSPSLAERVDALEAIVAPVDANYRYGTLGPVASKIYAGDQLGPRVGLTSEFFTLNDGTTTTDVDPAGRHVNVLSLAPTFGYRPHRRLFFNAQINFENGGAERSDTVTLRRGGAVVRFAYLDWVVSEDAGVRLGHQLIPIGVTNTDVDTITYLGTRRPPLERRLIPADWHENGALVYWHPGQVTVEGGAFASLNSRGFRADSFLSGGRAQGQTSAADDVMGVARVTFASDAWFGGASVAAGATAQGNEIIPGGLFRLGEMHAGYRGPRVGARVQLGRGQLDDAALIATFNQTNMGSLATGASAEVSVEALNQPLRQLWLFARGTHVDLNAEVPASLRPDPRLSETHAQLGAQYLPLPTLVLKADVTRITTGDDIGHEEFGLGAGYIF